jgi:hypothetical protein
MKTKPAIHLAAFFALAVLLCGACGGQNQTEKMKSLTVKKVSFDTAQPAIPQVCEMFDRENIEFHAIDQVNWPAFPYAPFAEFRIAHSDDEIYLQFHVKENDVRATFGYDFGSRPYTDSCVEFFMIPAANDSIYYNLEMNCIGHGTFAGRTRREDKQNFGDDVISQIRRESTLGSEPFGDRDGETEWTMTLAIPKAIYSLSPVQPFSGRTVKANFYKCGDDTKTTHYLSWNPIEIEKPNFHRPDFFGDLYFE